LYIFSLPVPYWSIPISLFNLIGPDFEMSAPREFGKTAVDGRIFPDGLVCNLFCGNNGSRADPVPCDSIKITTSRSDFDGSVSE